jgi:hypothetical protein
MEVNSAPFHWVWPTSISSFAPIGTDQALVERAGVVGRVIAGDASSPDGSERNGGAFIGRISFLFNGPGKPRGIAAIVERGQSVARSATGNGVASPACAGQAAGQVGSIFRPDCRTSRARPSVHSCSMAAGHVVSSVRRAASSPGNWRRAGANVDISTAERVGARWACSAE